MAAAHGTASVEADLEAGRTDYGRIHFQTPTTLNRPTSIEELARTLQACNQRGQPVTIRNTGHSTNGQTLTTNTQVNVSGLNTVRFDPNEMVALSGAGASWNDVISGVGFPKFAPPIFPNNPEQLIHVGGTTAVGGVGFYCSKYGGFWNHVSSIKLAMMNGDIVECSRTQNSDLFRYSLSGYGRVGVIAEVGVDVVESQQKVLGVVLAYFDDDAYERDLAKALDDPAFDGVAAQKDISGWEARVLSVLGVDLRLIIVLVETDGEMDVDETVRHIRRDYDEQMAIFVDAGGDSTGLELSLRPKLFDKRDVVYFTPSEQQWWRVVWSKILSFVTGKGYASTYDHTTLCHPWTDCVVSPERYTEFVDGAVEIIKANKMERYLEKESFLSGIVDIDSFVTFGIKRKWKDPGDRLPLSLDLPDVEKFSYGVAIMPNVPRKLLDAGMRTSREISNLVYELGGKRYLYGTHELTPSQVEQQFGRDEIETWQRLKDEHDPKHLLNIGVIEHLDT